MTAKHFVLRLFAAAGLATVFTVTAYADHAFDDSAYMTLQFDNDIFGGSDRHFTHGTRASWLSPVGKTPEFIRALATNVPLFESSQRMRIAYSVGQNIFTPEDIARANPDSDDRPYAGWLFAGIGLVAENKKRLDKLELDFGIVGPYSFANEVQTGTHDLIGVTKPEGWDHQLKTEPGIVLFYERSWRNTKLLKISDGFPFEDLAIDVTPHAGGAFGNVFIHAGAGVTFRFGDDLPNDFGPPKIRPNLPGSDFFDPDDRFGWYVFAGGELRLVVRNIFLDGNTFRSSRRVEKLPFVADFQIGFAVTFWRARLSYTQSFRTKEFEKQEGFNSFGSAAMSIRF